MEESIDMRGQVRICLTDRAGQVVHEQNVHNRIVKSGRLLVAQSFGGLAGGAPVTHVGVGTGTAQPSDADTGLQAQRATRTAISDRNLTDFAEPVPNSNAVVQRARLSLTAVFDFGEANDPATPLSEAAIFTAPTAGVMYNRVVFAPVTKTNAFKLTLFWDIVF